MANRVTPTGTDADNSSGSRTRAASIDWRGPRRFHVGTGHSEPSTVAGYTTTRDQPGKTRLSISLDFFGEPTYEQLDMELAHVSDARVNRNPVALVIESRIFFTELFDSIFVRNGDGWVFEKRHSNKTIFSQELLRSS